jgi:CRISPR/Cas system endoribonuclease Cas6 (RAMP superfamily)
MDRLQIRFLTMTRLKHGGTFFTTLLFHVLVRGLLRRLSSRLYFYHGIEWDADFVGLIERAKRVSTISENVQWVDWDRYSGRRGTHIIMGGLVGTVFYSGELGEFWPLLKIGEYVHVGKGSVFGMGKYRIG